MNAIKVNKTPIFLASGIPLVIIIFSSILAHFSFLSIYPELAIGVTYDLTITAPLIYLFFIRKTNIPKITAVPIFVGGTILATFLLPAQEQFHLTIIKTRILPLVEIGVFGFIGYSVYKTVKNYRSVKKSHTDIYRIIREVTKNTVKIPVLVKAVAFEIAVFYYLFIGWRRFKPGGNLFSYHKKSGTITLLGTVIFIIAIETIVLHILVAQWNEIIAWVLTILSFYFLIQLLAHIKAIFQRPIEISDQKLFIRYGLFGDTEIDLKNISDIEFSNIYPEPKENVSQMAMLPGFEPFNTIIHLKKEETYAGFYGIKSKFKTLLLFIDERENFIDLIKKK